MARALLHRRCCGNRDRRLPSRARCYRGFVHQQPLRQRLQRRLQLSEAAEVRKDERAAWDPHTYPRGNAVTHHVHSASLRVSHVGVRRGGGSALRYVFRPLSQLQHRVLDAVLHAARRIRLPCDAGCAAGSHLQLLSRFRHSRAVPATQLHDRDLERGVCGRNAEHEHAAACGEHHARHRRREAHCAPRLRHRVPQAPFLRAVSALVHEAGLRHVGAPP
mmetsp:Transcript_843/g.2890  ORF Transcript_843/g.2890 Transcript_843/m.2890 type:complete len:219 (+) Transcript_843:796-1452(+)